MKLSIFQIDAFTNRPFGGNPAAVVPLDAWLPDDIMQNIALENNLSETAFFVRQDDGYGLRWFTPTFEIDLCGHATLATAFVLFDQLGATEPVLRFHSKSGMLTVERDGDKLVLDFPSRPAARADAPEGLVAAIGREPIEIYRSRDYMLVYESEDDIRSISPDFSSLAKIRTHAVIVTAPGEECDFVSRFFAPEAGINEDPVTGSAHCNLIPFWAEKLGKTEMFARQLSSRGGELFCKHAGERVKIGGHATLYLKGEIFVEVSSQSSRSAQSI
ncbi:MAG: PhzF family phenazine biosynthesis protein [Blastocatellia bacterium]|nr:PhzF family phenazine biosynthesis protein [Blastocatellia bacterium]